MIKNEIAMWRYKSKIYIAVVLIICFVQNDFKTLYEYAQKIGYRVNICLIPYVFVHPYMRMILFLIVVFLMSDAPFITENQLFIISRMGKKLWGGCQIIYIAICSFLLDILFIIVPFIFNINKVFAGDKWGTAIKSISSQINILSPVSEEIYTKYTPMECLKYYLIILFLLFNAVGLFMYLANILRAGAAVAGILSGFVILDLMIHLTGIDGLLWISPVSWVRIDCLAYGLDAGVPGISQIIVIMLALNSLLCIAIYRTLEVMEISVTVKGE